MQSKPLVNERAQVQSKPLVKDSTDAIKALGGRDRLAP